MKQEIKEIAGDTVNENIWFEIGISKSDAAILKLIGSQNYGDNVSSAVVARHLLIMALAHYDKIEKLTFVAAKYADNEGLSLRSYLSSHIQNQHAALLKPVKSGPDEPSGNQQPA